MRDEAGINILDFTVPRIAFSFTYSILFGTFIIWAVGSTRTLRKIICDESDLDSLRKVPALSEARLWGLSPISRSKGVKTAFWMLSGDGLLLLATVTAIHIFGIYKPDVGEMDAVVYHGIGALSALILVASSYVSLKWIYPDWESIRIKLQKSDENAVSYKE